MSQSSLSHYSGVQINRKFNKYESMGSIDKGKQLNAHHIDRENFVTNFVGSASMRREGSNDSLQRNASQKSIVAFRKSRKSVQPLRASASILEPGTTGRVPIPRQANTTLKELSFFLKILEAKVRFDPELGENCAVKLVQLNNLFGELNFKLTGAQINDLHLN